jgi:hypothetical protein
MFINLPLVRTLGVERTALRRVAIEIRATITSHNQLRQSVQTSISPGIPR